jgi:hypothetical protein
MARTGPRPSQGAFVGVDQTCAEDLPQREKKERRIFLLPTPYSLLPTAYCLLAQPYNLSCANARGNAMRNR